MATELRKVVTGHASNRKPVVVGEEQLTAVLRAVSESITNASTKLTTIAFFPRHYRIENMAIRRDNFILES